MKTDFRKNQTKENESKKRLPFDRNIKVDLHRANLN